MIKNNGFIYKNLSNKLNYNEKLKECIEDTVENLIKVNTSSHKPGMLLGKIQSGKTRTFIGVMGLAFDNDYDVAVVLTKGTRALAEQTYQRLNKDFKDFVDNDMVQVFDIMHLCNNLRPYELNQKLVFIVKKEVHNLDRLGQALFNTYSSLSQKKILIIDDEADYASIGFTKTKQEGLEINKISQIIDDIRSNLKQCSFLQVTATPYSLYLQPEDMKLGGMSNSFKPVRPAFTSLVPVGEGYIGGNYYFDESEYTDTIASFIYEQVEDDELKVLKKEDRRSLKIENSLESNKVKSIRNGIVNFIVGGCIRRLQAREKGEFPLKYSFIVHTEHSKASHEWQEKVAEKIVGLLKVEAENNTEIFYDLINESYESFKKSIELLETPYIPDFMEVKLEVTKAILQGYVLVNKVNSEKDVNELLDESGQLKLRTPLNIFIGGQILDRGITVGNLIGFYYGRNPATFQQDTVLQHSRMYGYRPLEDLAVTRFYTTIGIYDVMKKIHEFDTALREEFEKGGQDKGVVFIRKDANNKIVPCSPNKILLSKVTTLKPHKRILPTGFDTHSKSKNEKLMRELDELIVNSNLDDKNYKPFLMEYSKVEEIVTKINETLVFADGYNWDVKSFLSCISYLSSNTDDSNLKNKVWIIPRVNRNMSKFTAKDRYSDAPDTPRSANSEAKIAKDIAIDIPALILLRQNGKEELKWKGSPFWWPVLLTSKNTETVVFAEENVE